MHWILPEKSIGFSVQIKVIYEKKRSFIYFYCSIYFVLFCWFPKKKREGKGGLGGRAEHAQNISNCPKNIKLSKILTQNCPSNVKSPKNLTHNCLKNMKLPDILTRDRHLKTKRGTSAPPPPPPTPLQGMKNEHFTEVQRSPDQTYIFFDRLCIGQSKLEKFFHDKNFAWKTMVFGRIPTLSWNPGYTEHIC